MELGLRRIDIRPTICHSSSLYGFGLNPISPKISSLVRSLTFVYGVFVHDHGLLSVDSQYIAGLQNSLIASNTLIRVSEVYESSMLSVVSNILL